MREFTQSEKETLEFLGNFGPTVNVEHRMLKGYTHDGKTYLDTADLRTIANDLLSIASWLDDREMELK